MRAYRGKTEPERLQYGPNERSLKARSPFRRTVASSDMGETRVVAYVPSELKHELRAVADERREHSNAENSKRLTELLLEALNRGWTVAEMRSATRLTDNAVRLRLKAAG